MRYANLLDSRVLSKEFLAVPQLHGHRYAQALRVFFNIYNKNHSRETVFALAMLKITTSSMVDDMKGLAL